MLKKEVHFSIDGEWFTNRFRDMYYYENLTTEELKTKFIKCLGPNTLSDEEKNELFESIIYGEKKFIGCNEFELVEDKEFDIQSYSKFLEPKFIDDERGVRGILTKAGMFVQCGYGEHQSIIAEIGKDRCKGCLVFFLGLASSGIYKDNTKEKLTKKQLEWCEAHKIYFNEEQKSDWITISEIEKEL